MLFDVKLLRSDMEHVRQAMANRGKEPEELNRFASADTKRRELLQEVEALKKPQKHGFSGSSCFETLRWKRGQFD